MQPIRITALRTTTVAVPLEAALRHANGAHWGRFIRTIVEVDTDAGITGLGEMGGGGESAALAFKGLEPYLLGHDPFQLEALRWKIANPTASLYNNRTQLLAAIEFACLDIMGQALGVPVHALLGGALRDTVPFAAYLFYKWAEHPALDGRPAVGDDWGEALDPAGVVEQARLMQQRYGFRSFKLKGGVFPPDEEIAAIEALAEAFPGQPLRLDPNTAWTVETSKYVARRLDGVLEGALFRIVQEALCNVRRHSKAPSAEVTLVCDCQHVSLVVADSGVGFDPGQTRMRQFGLRGMQERARLIGGTIAIQSAPGQGTRIVVELPLAASGEMRAS